MFNTLGRFQGLNDEMGFIVLHSLAEYPLHGRPKPRSPQPPDQLAMSATGEGANGWIPHTLPASSSAIPAQLAPMREAKQQQWQLDFTAINRLPRCRSRWPRCSRSRCCSATACGDGGATTSRCSPGTVTLALLGNAFVCGVISGPHDRYGARMVWVATFVVLIAAARASPSTTTSRILLSP